MSSLKQIKKKLIKAVTVESSRPADLLQRFSKKHPEFWKTVEKSKQVYLAKKLDWPSWCHVPMSPRYPEFSKKLSNAQFNDAVLDLAISHGFSGWRLNPNIFKFDEHLAGFLARTPFKDIPASCFQNIPYHCLYIQLPTNFCTGLDGELLHGAFFFLDFDVASSATLLWVIFDPVRSVPYSVPFNLKKGFLSREYIASMEAKIHSKHIESPVNSISRILNLFLYLNAEKSDFGTGREPRFEALGLGVGCSPILLSKPSKSWNIGNVVGERLATISEVKRQPYWMIKNDKLRWVAPVSAVVTSVREDIVT